MKFKTSMIAAILALSPTLALAMGGCGSEHREQTAMSCAEGFIHDVETGVCVPVVTG